MTIYQVVFSLAYGDAIGNDVLAIDEAIREMGYDTGIYASVIDKRVEERAQYLDTLRLESTDVVIYHKASGGPLSDWFRDVSCRKIMLYHNITPAEFFAPYSKYRAKRLAQGREQLAGLVGKVDYCLADSEYNREELIAVGFEAEQIDVLPIIMDFEDYKRAPNQEVLSRYGDGKTNLLFTGRIAPNKKHEDIIKAFYYYKNYVDEEARLFLVGSYDGSEKYYAKLKGFVADLGLADVYFTGHVPFDHILAYYDLADVFVCMSEHEGFCVPLLESMFFDVPIVAYKSSAIPYTLGGSGVLIDHKDYGQFADAIQKVVGDQRYRDEIIAGQRVRLGYFEREHTKVMLKEYLSHFCKTNELGEE